MERGLQPNAAQPALACQLSQFHGWFMTIAQGTPKHRNVQATNHGHFRAKAQHLEQGIGRCCVHYVDQDQKRRLDPGKRGLELLMRFND